jgi:hypothetical protein
MIKYISFFELKIFVRLVTFPHIQSSQTIINNYCIWILFVACLFWELPKIYGDTISVHSDEEKQVLPFTAIGESQEFYLHCVKISICNS